MLTTLPPSHPLHKLVMNAVKRLVKHHLTLLHDLMHRYKIQPQNMEISKAVCFSTGWTPKVAIKTANNEDEVIANVNQDSPDVKVGIHGWFRNGRQHTVLYKNGRVKVEL